MKALKSNELTLILQVELDQGNLIDQDVHNPCWPPVSRFIRLATPFKSDPENGYPSLRYLKVDDFHYWFEEIADAFTDEVIVCGFNNANDNFAPAIETKKSVL